MGFGERERLPIGAGSGPHFRKKMHPKDICLPCATAMGDATGARQSHHAEKWEPVFG